MPAPMLEELFVTKYVAFAPSKESWMSKQTFGCGGTAYIVGRVVRRVKRAAIGRILQNARAKLSVVAVQRGIENYQSLGRLPNNPAWRDLTDNVTGGKLRIDAPLGDLKVSTCTKYYEMYDPVRFLPASLAEVEAVKNMRFQPDIEMNAPRTFTKAVTKNDNKAYRHIFAHSASYIFLADVPLYFWNQVVLEANLYAAIKKKRLGPQTEDTIFGGASTILDNIMSLNRFNLLRRCFSFRSDPEGSVERDPAARICPLLNLLKCTGGRYNEVGRDIALDEASVACRSRQGRYLIVFNPQKPGGNYHFCKYVVCCAATWIALNYRLRCNTSDVADRLQDLATHGEIQQLREEFEKVSQVRKHVLEVVRPYYYSRRSLTWTITTQWKQAFFEAHYSSQGKQHAEEIINSQSQWTP
ncbi:Transposase [Phytophthora palmivora]|uniref:Transposase n=1 Tax=Phytophthora palmivora TaxID=4796 RepID=A0A2P4XUU7_9STRA|nr:Transposase [Phytophthora palmivora]